MPAPQAAVTLLEPPATHTGARPRPGRGAAATVGSIITCVLVIVQLLLAMLVMTYVMPRFSDIFEDFEAEVPALTGWLISIPPSTVVAVSMTLIVLVIGKEFVFRDRRVTLTINLLLMVAMFVWIPLLVVGLFLPLVRLMESIA